MINQNRLLVIGDIHGAYKALLQCLERINFNKNKDLLICLGDVVDGWPQTKECINLLMSFPNLIMIKGNHDEMAIEWAESGEIVYGWKAQGGYATVESYEGKMDNVHLAFLKNANSYYLKNNNLFVHGGIRLNVPLEEQDDNTFLWDRTLFNMAFPHRNEQNPPQLTNFNEIYIGHTPVHRYGYNKPLQACEIWMMDTGAGWDGVLSIMDIDSKEYKVSDPVKTLYPDHPGRFIS